MESQLWENIIRTFNVELPKDLETMDDMLDWILPKVKPLSEDLYEEENFLATRWKEFSDNDDFQEAILHIFLDEGEYMLSIDGDISSGAWKTLQDSNTMILDRGGANELYDLEFLHKDFFVLSKHGDQQRKGRKKYFVLAKEDSSEDLEWRDIMENIFNLYRRNALFMTMILLIVFMVLFVLVLSLR